MPTTRFPIPLLPLLVTLSVASACANRPPPVVQSFPLNVDLQVEPKPVAGPDILTSEKAANDYDASLEAWGERGWATVGRICKWAKEMGAKVSC